MRPLIRAEIAKGGRKDIIRVIDGRVVIVLDPDENKVGLRQPMPWIFRVGPLAPSGLWAPLPRPSRPVACGPA